MKNIFVSFIYSILVRPWLTFIIGVSFHNIKPLKDANQFIIVANHNSHFDTVSIMAALPSNKRKNTCAVASGDYFGKSPFTVTLMKLFFNAILITKKTKPGHLSNLELLDQRIKEGKSLIMYPEGSRGNPGTISSFKKGIAKLLKENPSVPFIPVYLDGFGRVLPKNKILIVPLICKVRFGSPLFATTNDTKTTLEEVKKEILNLKQKNERDRNQFDFY